MTHGWPWLAFTVLMFATTPALAAPEPEPDADEPTAPTQAPLPAAVRIAWSGGSRGVEAGTYSFHLHERLGRAGAPALADVRSSYAVMAQGPWMLASSDRTLRATLEVIEGEPPTCVAPRPAMALVTAGEIAIFDDEGPPWAAFWPAERRPLTRWVCEAGDRSADLFGPRDRDPAEVTWQLPEWETRLSLTWTLEPLADGAVPLRVPIVGRPIGDGPRRARQLVELVQDGVIFADAGRFVPGISVLRDDELSSNRGAGLDLLRRVQASALAPGFEELVAGPRKLLDEAGDLPWVATNWRTRDDALQVPASRLVTVQTYGREARVAFLGALDPGLHGQIPSIAEQGVTIGDPVSAIQEEVGRLRSASPAPDLVVVLSTAGPNVLARLRQELRGVDFLLGDPTERYDAIDALELSLSPRARDAPPLSLPGEPLMLAEAALAPEGGLRAVYVSPQPIDLDAPPDPEVLAAITTSRAARYPELDRPLLPAPAGPAGSALADGAFARIACEAVRARTKADLVFLPDLPSGQSVPGELSVLQVARRMRVPDHLEEHLVPGDRLGRLLDQLYNASMPHCGTALGSRSPTVNGRAIEPDQMYRVITTDRHRQTSQIGNLLDGARNPAALGGKGYRPLTDASGRPRTLRATTIEALQELRAEHDDRLLTELLARRTAPAPPRWMLRLRTLSFRLEGFQGAEDPAFSQVPETLATAPSSLTLGSAADIALHYDERRVSWDARIRHAYTRLRTAAIVQETADDLRFSSSVSLPGLTTPSLFGLAARPFGEGLLDSEWTPIVNAEGETLPRQLDLSFTFGLATQPKGWLRTLRLGFIGMQDLSRTDKRLNLGSRIEAETAVPFGPGLRWLSQLHMTAFANTPDQDARDLRLRALLDSRVAMPLLRGLDLAFYGNLFVFQGRIPETSAVRRSFTLGVSLDARGAFVLNR